jgi:hypothetical protein
MIALSAFETNTSKDNKQALINEDPSVSSMSTVQKGFRAKR